jgi:O-antigen/teichoic acid export membrane protein
LRKLLQGQFKKQVGATFLTQFVGLAFAIASSAIIARWLGPEGKGMLALALLLPGIMGLWLGGGIEVANVYYTGSRRLDVQTLTANSLGFAVITSILGIGLIFGLVVTGWLDAFVPGIPIQYVLLAMVGFPLGLLGGYFSSILLGLQRILAVNLVTLTQNALKLALTAVTVIGLGGEWSTSWYWAPSYMGRELLSYRAGIWL